MDTMVVLVVEQRKLQSKRHFAEPDRVSSETFNHDNISVLDP